VSGEDDEDLRALRGAPPPPRADFVDGVMRQLATRPLPRPSLWRRLWAERQVTLRLRPATLLGAAVLAALVLLVARPRPTRVVTPLWTMDRAATGAHARTPALVPTPAPRIVRFALAAQKARAVSLAGDFNGWRPDTTPLVRGADGVWSVEVPLERGNWSYSFIVDGVFVEDPLAQSWRADGFGGKNAVVRVGLDADDVGSARGG
jgi:hypothetical protein